MAIPFLKGIDVAGTVDLTNLTIDGAQGTDGQVLTSTGGGIAWEDASGGGSLSGGAANKLAIWTSATALTNDTNLHWDTTNDRLGIGTATPGQKLDVNGSINVGGQYSGAMYFSQTTTGPRIVGTNPSLGGQLDLYTGNVVTPRIRITSAGNVGIGETNANRPLVVSETRTGSTASDAYTTVVKSVQSSGASPNPGTGGLKVQYTSSSSNVHAFGLVAGSSSSDFLTTGPMHFYTNSDLDTVSATGFAMQLDTSQRLILGSMTASQKLNVSGNVTADRYYGNGSTVYYIDPNDGTQSANLTAKIRVGTGTLNLSSAPTWGVSHQNIFASTDTTNGGTVTLMNVSSTYAGGDASGTLQFVIAGGNTSLTGGGYGVAAITAISRNNPGSGTSGGGNLIFKTSVGYGSVLEKMRLTDAGRLGIGVDPTEKLHVNGNFLVNNTSGAANGSAHEIARLINTTSGATSSYMYIGASSGNDWRIGKNILGTSGGSNFGIAKHSGSTLALEIDGSNNATVAGNVRAAGFTTDGNAKFYTWRALNNTSNSSNQYYRIARITATQSTRFIIELAGRSTSYTDGTIPAFGKIVGQLNNDNNYDIVYYNASATDEVVDEVGQVDVSTTATDIYIRVGQYAELTATAHISDGTITTYGGDSASTSAPTNYVQATEYKLWNTGNDGINSGLDADLLDGEQGSYYLNYNNFTNTPSAYSHPTHPGDDISVDTGALTGATVISDLDFNITTDTLGHVTDANAAISTRALTASDITTGTFNDLFANSTRYNFGLIDGNSSQTRDKIRVWNSSSYTIGMKSGFTYGHLNDYAMSFQMNDDNDRGFWWGDTAHSDAQGAMSLTTNGRLTVAESISVGQGQSITSAATHPLYVDGTAVFDTTSNAEPVCITRSGSVASQVLKIGVTDTVAQFNYIEDTSNEGTGNFGQYDFILGGNSSESSTTAFVITQNGVQAQNFYDYDNTGFYFQPESTSGTSWRLQTPTGYLKIGSRNSSYVHFYTDRGQYYFDKGLTVDTGAIRSYNEDLNLNRAGSSTARVVITDGLTRTDQNMRITGTSGNDAVLTLKDGNTSGYIGSEINFTNTSDQQGARIEYLSNPGASEMRIFTEGHTSTNSIRIKTDDSYFNNRVHADQFVGQTYIITGSQDHTFQNSSAYWWYNWHQSTSFSSVRYAENSFVAPFDGYLGRIYHRGVGLDNSSATTMNFRFYVNGSNTNISSSSVNKSGSGSNIIFEFTNTTPTSYDFNEGDRIEVQWNINALFGESCYAVELVRKTT